MKKEVENGREFEKYPEWGIDLGSDHECFLAEGTNTTGNDHVCVWLFLEHFKKPVIVYDYPKGFKAFYMRLNDDNKTVAAMDVLIPGVLRRNVSW